MFSGLSRHAAVSSHFSQCRLWGLSPPKIFCVVIAATIVGWLIINWLM